MTRRPLNALAAVQQLAVCLALDGLGSDVDLYVAPNAFEVLRSEVLGGQRERRKRSGSFSVYTPAGRVTVFTRGE